MHDALLILHSYFRWLVLLAGLVAVAKMFAGWTKSLAWTEADRRAAVLFTVAIDVQLLLGLALFAVSPLVRNAMRDIATAMATPDVRIFVADHPATMLIALALAHAGSAAAKRAATDAARFRQGAILYGLSLALILWGIPWFRLFTK